MKIGQFKIKQPIILAPMSGVTDAPYRQICQKLGASFSVSEMVAARSSMRGQLKTNLRLASFEKDSPRVIQLLGSDPSEMSYFAAYARDLGADIIDINMGCPAKKVAKKHAGSALMGTPLKAVKIVEAVIAAVDCPVTVKIRTGISSARLNAVVLSQEFEKCGVQAITVHGRTRDCSYRLPAEYSSVRKVKDAVKIPVIVNGDIEDGKTASNALQASGADAIMIGRASCGNPWIFQMIRTQLNDVKYFPPDNITVLNLLEKYVDSLYSFYGLYRGLLIARKHVNWFLQKSELRYLVDSKEFNKLKDVSTQFKFFRKIRKRIA